MATETYIGVAERTGSGYSVFFPDVPGCVSAGSTLFEAFSNGEEALAAHLQLLSEAGEELPPASENPDIDEDIDIATYFLAHVDLPGKAVRLNITMDEGLVASIDRVAKNRSAFLAEAAREALARRRAEDMAAVRDQAARKRELTEA